MHGQRGNTVEPHSPRQLAAWKKAQKEREKREREERGERGEGAEGCAELQRREFQVEISKKGQKLGIRYDDSDGVALVIKIINPGIFYAAGSISQPSIIA
eukprot:Skav235256  [mRNA]  locus=scaffold874:23465:25247:+ [translate_table: standard]